MADDQHGPYCSVFAGAFADQTRPDETKPCSCGFRKRQTEERIARQKFLLMCPPLNMTDHDFLRTLGIDPEDTYGV